jgi:hypothetical protein
VRDRLSLTAVDAALAPRLPAILLGVAFAWAVLAGSNFFQVSTWIVGDIAYHRGVAGTMQGADWQGEGPYVGLLTYYGGLYPLVLGRLSSLLGQPFDVLLSVTSWGFALVWPLACWWFGRRVWPGRPLAVALFVLLATTAAPLTNRVLLWVDSPLVSAQNVFPVYPRDVALVLLVVACGSLWSPTGRRRVVEVGLALAGILLVHLQVALLAAWILGTLTILRSLRRRDPMPFLELVLSGLMAALISAWWWIPRLLAAIRSGGLLLGGYPGSPPLRVGPENVVMVFGVVAILAILGLAVLAARRPLPGRMAFFIAWLAVSLPLIAVDRLLGGSDLVSERRVWLIMSIPLTALAAATAAAVAVKLKPLAVVAFVVVFVILPSVPGTVATARLVRDAWQPGRAGGRIFPAAQWDPIFADLNRRVQADGRHVALSYDAYETWIWSFSGAQVPSLWLPGPFKLGFDPARLTGQSHLERLEAQEAAFDNGRPGICEFARSSGAASVVLDVQGGLVGTYDESPASRYRVDPRERSGDTIERVIGNGQTYIDRGGYDVLELAPGATWRPAFASPMASRVAVEFNVGVPPPGQAVQPTALGTIETGLGATAFGAGLAPGWARVVVPVDGVDGRIAVVASGTVDLLRFTAFEPLADVGDGLPDGPVRLDPASFCRE